ncbi:MAG: hypothetical protein ACFFFT_12670, partial [Candidatus Thorarchaeota archaeon]
MSNQKLEISDIDQVELDFVFFLEESQQVHLINQKPKVIRKLLIKIEKEKKNANNEYIFLIIN